MHLSDGHGDSILDTLYPAYLQIPMEEPPPLPAQEKGSFEFVGIFFGGFETETFLLKITSFTGCVFRGDGPESANKIKVSQIFRDQSQAGWWFQPLWKISVKMGIFPN